MSHDPNSTPSPAYRQVVAALADSEERYRIMVEGVRRYAIFLLGPTGIALTWNRGVEELLGYRREEFLGSSGAICFTTEDRDGGVFEAELVDAERLGEKIEDRSAQHKNGQVLSVHDSVTALRDGAGALLGFAKVTRERKTQEVADTQRSAELANTVALLEAEIENRRRLETELLTAVEQERQRLGQDLHDDLSQHLGGISMLAGVLASRLQEKAPEESANAENISQLVRDAITVARNLAHGLHPVTLSAHGLPAALAELAQRVPLSVEFRWPQTKRVNLMPDVALHVYRIAEEAVGNALKHSGASKIIIGLTTRRKAREAVISIRDNGQGFTPGAATAEGMGLRNMRYRAGIIGGRLSVESKPGKGTCVRCVMPLASKAQG